MDETIAAWAASFSTAHPHVHSLAYFMTDAYSVKALPFIALLIAFWFKDDKIGRSRRAVLAGIAGCFVALTICRMLQNFGPHRPRPLFNGAFDFPHAGIPADWSSFPSDTSGIVFALVAAIFMASRGVGCLALVLALAGPVFGKLMTGSHYLSDMVAGALIGACATTALYLALTRYPRPVRAIDRTAARHPALFHFAGFLLIFQLCTFFDDARRFASAALKVAGIQASAAPAARAARTP